MSTTHRALSLFLTLGMMMVSVCGGFPANTAQGDEGSNPKPAFDNGIDFVYDSESNLAVDDFDGLMTLTDCYVSHRMSAIHNVEGAYYTVYSLKDNSCAI